jgi:hypothetical protein
VLSLTAECLQIKEGPLKELETTKQSFKFTAHTLDKKQEKQSGPELLPPSI